MLNLCKKITAALLVSFVAALPALAEYPDKPIKMIIGFGPGGATDTLGRLVAKAAEDEFGVPVIVENMPGGGGMVASSNITKLPADGYTIALVADFSIAAAPLVSDSIKYTVDDFEYITTISRFQTAFYTSKDSPYKTWEEMIAYAKEGNELSASTAGPVQTQYFDYIAKRDGITITSVPFKSGRAIVQAVMGGHVSFGFSVGIHQSLMKDGGITVLSVPLDERLPTTPDVPTMAELGYEHNLDGYFVFVAPKDMPDDIKSRMAAVFQNAAQSDEVKKLSQEKMRMPSVVLNPEDTRGLMKSFAEDYSALFESTK